MELRILTTVPEMLPHFPLVLQLTPTLTAEEYAALLHAMVPHRYAMLAAYDGDRCAGLSGFWIGHKLYSGRYLEIDNFIVDVPYRSHGVGRLLVEELVRLAGREGCRHVMLDAYLQNTTAHGFYERLGFVKKGYHFMRSV